MIGVNTSVKVENTSKIFKTLDSLEHPSLMCTFNELINLFLMIVKPLCCLLFIVDYSLKNVNRFLAQKYVNNPSEVFFSYMITLFHIQLN